MPFWCHEAHDTTRHLRTPLPDPPEHAQVARTASSFSDRTAFTRQAPLIRSGERPTRAQVSIAIAVFERAIATLERHCIVDSA